MKNRIVLAAALAACLAAPATFAKSSGGFELGVGANYWYSLKDAVHEDFDEDGLGWMISSRWMWTDYVGLGLELERSPKNFVELEKEMYAPSAHIILGSGLYIGLGVGCYYYDGDFYEDTWYNLRAGIKVEIIPHIIFDINANYRADSFSDIKGAKGDIDGETVTLGGAIRIGF